MGKDNLLIGTARGKLGDVVFYRTGGEQRFRVRVRPTNPRTNAQLLQRTVISTATSAYTNLVTVCDHAFQNFEGKLKNQQRFMKLNAMKLREIALSRIESWSPIKFKAGIAPANWRKKDDIYTYANSYIISEGDLQNVEGTWTLSNTAGGVTVPSIEIPLKSGITAWQQMTYQDVADSLGLQIGDQITMIAQTANKYNGAIKTTTISRIILMPNDGDVTKAFAIQTESDTYVINDPNKENYGSMLYKFGEDSTGDVKKVVLFFAPSFQKEIAQEIASFGIITSRYENNMWRRSSSEMNLKQSFYNLTTLRTAMESYEKDTTSSLYLNQASTDIENDAVAVLAETEKDAVAVIEELEEEEKKTRKK